jgi:uncharacterized protein (TIGR00255 family)
MAVSSMTGFARVDGAHDGRRWTWEIKSVNGRGLELRFRLPPGFDHIELDLRRVATEAFARGSLNANLVLARTASGSTLRINHEALEQAVRMIEALRARMDCEKPSAEGVLSIRGVVEPDEGEEDEASREAFGNALSASFRKAAAALREARMAEGASLALALAAHVDEIERLVGVARSSAAASPEAIRARVGAQLAELAAGAGISEERLAQEAALLAIKADIREELDRLDAHVVAARALLKDKEPVGRRLDFLTQEFNREANTLCSKAPDMGLKRLGLDLKTVIDQMREQVQNVE